MIYSPFNPETQNIAMIIDALLSNNSHINIVDGSIVLRFGDAYEFTDVSIDSVASVSFYDGSLPLGIDSGLLFTSGLSILPMTNNEESWSNYFISSYFLTANGLSDVPADLENVDVDLRTAVDAAFSEAGDLYDITSLEFSFNVTDPQLLGVSFEVLFGSDEYPEFTDSPFVDIAGVFVNGTNYALFNQESSQPLSILSENLELGNYINNENSLLPIEYDGISSLLRVVAPVHQGVNTIKIAIADTGDSIYDSGIFISSLQGVDHEGYGLAEVVEIPPGQTTPYNDVGGNQIYEMGTGNLSLIINGGDDVVNDGDGVNTVIFKYSLSGLLNYSYVNETLTLNGPTGNTQLVGIERVQLSDGLFAFDTTAPDADDPAGGKLWQVEALFQAAFGRGASMGELSQWTAQADLLADMGDLGQRMIDYYAPGVSSETLVTHLYVMLTQSAPTTAQVQGFVDQIGPGRTFETQGELFAFAADLDLNTVHLAGFNGSIQALDQAWF